VTKGTIYVSDEHLRQRKYSPREVKFADAPGLSSPTYPDLLAAVRGRGGHLRGRVPRGRLDLNLVCPDIVYIYSLIPEQIAACLAPAVHYFDTVYEPLVLNKRGTTRPPDARIGSRPRGESAERVRQR